MADKQKKDKGANPMKAIGISTVTINIGTGNDSQQQENARKLITLMTGRKPADGISKKRIPQFKISPGSKIGAFVTIRGEDARKLAAKLLGAVDNKINERCITDNSLSFGIKEYIDINGIKYDPKIGMLGMNVNIAFKRKGIRTGLKKRARGEVGRAQRFVTKEDIKSYIGKELSVSLIGAV